jgi:hypothetical protein
MAHHRRHNLLLVTASILDNNNKLILPWTITQFSGSSSVSEFFRETIQPRIKNDCDLFAALLGQEMHSLVLVDINLPLVAIVPELGLFLQYKMSISNSSVSHESLTAYEEENFLPFEIFYKLKHIPHPTPMEDTDGHYLPFSGVYEKPTSEEHRPSFKPHQPKSKKKRTLPYYATVQHVKNANLMVQCAECEMWRLVFSHYKLYSNNRKELQLILNDNEYSCGASLADLHLPEIYKDVEIRAHNCYYPIERLYYSAKFAPICIYCAADQSFTVENVYLIVLINLQFILLTRKNRLQKFLIIINRNNEY